MSIESLLRQPVRTLPPDAPCQEAAQLLRDEGVGCVVVSEDERPLGIVTDRDLVVRRDGAGPGSLDGRWNLQKEMEPPRRAHRWRSLGHSAARIVDPSRVVGVELD